MSSSQRKYLPYVIGEVGRDQTSRRCLSHWKTIRPVKALFSNSSTANVILTRAKNLKQSDQYSTVYIRHLP